MFAHAPLTSKHFTALHAIAQAHHENPEALGFAPKAIVWNGVQVSPAALLQLEANGLVIGYAKVGKLHTKFALSDEGAGLLAALAA